MSNYYSFKHKNMDYYNNKALEIILKYQEKSDKNIVILNDYQKYIAKILLELKEENKSLREDLSLVKSVFNLDKESTKDEVIPSPPKEYQEMIDILNKKPNYKNGLSVRNHNCLSSANIRTNYDLVKCGKRDLLSIRNFGKHSYDEVIQYLNWNNLTIGMDVSEYEPYLKQSNE